MKNIILSWRKVTWNFWRFIKISDFTQDFLIARRAFVWQTFKNRCPSGVRVRCPRFFGKSCRAYSDRDTIFGFIYLGKISKSEKSKIQNVIWYLVIVTTSSFFEEKIKERFAKYIWPKNQNFSQVGPYAQCKNKNVQLFADGKNHDPRQIDVFESC